MKKTSLRSVRASAALVLTVGALAACGGGDTQGAMSDQTQLLANGETCNAAWNSTTAYSGGAKVSYSGVNYTAAYWTQGNNPSTSNGPAGSGQPWIAGYTCGGTTTTTTKATTTTTKATTTTTKATTTTTKAVTTTTQAGTTTTKATTTTTVASACPTYVAGTAYAAGKTVTNAGAYYTCDVSGWCSSGASAYAPGIGWAWTSAWHAASASACGGTTSTTTTSGGTTSTTKVATTTTVKASTTTLASTTTTSLSGQVVRYLQSFNALTTGALWNYNIDQAKIKARPENAKVTAACGIDGSNCFKITYRHADGIHKAPQSSPVFVTNSAIGWAPSDSTHTNTATDVTQSNIMIGGSTNDLGHDDNLPVPSKNYTLSYNVYFEPGFDFAKGGKLPGLASRMFDSGCTEDGSSKRLGSNWSVRLMWRANGRVELYSYDQSRPSGSCGIDKMIDEVAGDPRYEVPGQIPADAKFRFQPGTWYTITLAVKVNDNNSVTYQLDGSGHRVLDDLGDPIPTGGNGAVTLKIANAAGTVSRTMVYPNVALRDECNGTCPASAPDSKDTWVNAVFFSTFFGGNETKRTTCLSSTPPSYPGLTQEIFDRLCASQRVPAIYPNLTWNPQTYSAARFDNIKVVEGYLGQ